MTEERARGMSPGYRVLEVRRAWSATVVWQVEAADCHTGERLLLLSEDQFDRRLTMEVGQPKPGEITTAQTTTQVTAHTNERAATLLTS